MANPDKIVTRGLRMDEATQEEVEEAISETETEEESNEIIIADDSE